MHGEAYSLAADNLPKASGFQLGVRVLPSVRIRCCFLVTWEGAGARIQISFAKGASI